MTRFTLLVLLISVSTQLLSAPIYDIKYGCSLTSLNDQNTKAIDHKQTNLYYGNAALRLRELESQQLKIKTDNNSIDEKSEAYLTASILTRYNQINHYYLPSTTNYLKFKLSLLIEANDSVQKIETISAEAPIDINYKSPSIHEIVNYYGVEYNRVFTLSKTAGTKNDLYKVECQVLVREK